MASFLTFTDLSEEITEIVNRVREKNDKLSKRKEEIDDLWLFVFSYYSFLDLEDLKSVLEDIRKMKSVYRRILVFDIDRLFVMEKEEIAVKELTREQLEQIRKAAFLDADFLREKRKDSRNQED